MKLGLVGAKLGHSYSRTIHGHFHRLTGLEGSYDLIEIPEESSFRERVRELARQGYRGLNVTIPYKINMLEMADEASPEAERTGAANTVVFKDGKIYAHNTDYFGFRTALVSEGLDKEGKKWVVLGSGGSSRSVRAVLEDLDASDISIVSRHKRGNGFIGYDEIEEGWGLVNTTPLGMYPNTEGCALEDKEISGFSAVVDLIYNPSRTVLLKKAQSMGIKTANGLMMLTAQAIRAQEIWRGSAFGLGIINEIYGIMEEGDG